MIYLQLFYEFFKIGLFSIGGGMASVPFLQNLAVSSGWYDVSLVSEMIAVSESTPGPIGINMATYVGYTVAGIPGGIIASLAICVPSLIIVFFVFKSLTKFAGSKLVDYTFYGLRPGVVALIAYAALTIIPDVFIKAQTGISAATHEFSLDYKKIIYFCVCLAAIMLTKKKKWAHPIIFIAISAVVGILLEF